MKLKLLTIALICITLIGCVPDISMKKSCENSGGEYKKGFTETKGAYYYCKCPADSYLSDSTCKAITQTEIDLCEAESNEYVDCEIDGNLCKCTFESGTVSYFSISQLKKMSCECSADACGCLGQGLR